MKRALGTAGTLISLALLTTGCPGDPKGNDAGTNRVKGDRRVVEMPDGYSNQSSACVSGVLVIVGDNGTTFYDERHLYHICDGRPDGPAPDGAKGGSR